MPPARSTLLRRDSTGERLGSSETHRLVRRLGGGGIASEFLDWMHFAWGLTWVVFGALMLLWLWVSFFVAIALGVRHAWRWVRGVPKLEVK